MVGTLLAVFVADLVSHLVVHASTPTRLELTRTAQATLGAFSAVVLPLLALAAAGAGLYSLDAGLTAAVVALVVSLALIGYLAVRRVPMQWWQRLVALGAESVLGLVVVGLELLAHG